MQSKACTKCKEVKTIVCYSPQRRGLMGVRSICKPCAAKVISDYNKKLKESNGFQTPETKKCATCGETKGAAAFNKGTGITGLYSACKPCQRQENRERRARLSAVEVSITEKKCCKCKETKVISEFSKNRVSRDGLLPHCQECHRKASLKWNKDNPEKYSATQSKRRARKLRATPKWLNAAHYAEIESLFLFCKLFPGHEVDHIVPLQGKNVCGLHTPDNMQILTIEENRSKGNRFDG